MVVFSAKASGIERAFLTCSRISELEGLGKVAFHASRVNDA
jgi:hypothetical protein